MTPSSRRFSRWIPAIVLVIVAGGVTLLAPMRRRPQHWPDAVRPATAVGDST